MTVRLLAPVDAAARWVTRPVPIARIAWLRAILYAFIWVDVLATTAWVGEHDTAPGSFYRPLLVGRLLHLPTPDHFFVRAIEVLLLVCAAAAATGRLPRLLGAAVFLLYGEWMVIAMSYGKVDHDRFAFLVVLAVLPLVGRARFGDRRPSEAAGFAVKATMVAVVATYFFSTWAKSRFGPGIFNWMDSAVFVRAITRRHTELGGLLLPHPDLLVVAQWGLVAMEFFSPVLLVLKRKPLYAALTAYALFHLTTYLVIRIIFLPHLMCLLVFLPLERLLPAGRGSEAGPDQSSPVHAPPPERSSAIGAAGRWRAAAGPRERSAGQRGGCGKGDGGDGAVQCTERSQGWDAGVPGQDQRRDRGLGGCRGQGRADQDQVSGEPVGDHASEQQQQHVGQRARRYDQSDVGHGAREVQDSEGQRDGCESSCPAARWCGPPATT